jgi:D-tyrosyl-tRNA(Tyr) deacylase
MVAVIQRVRQASVEVENRTVASIGKGILCFLGVEKGDTQADAEYIAARLPKLRIFDDENGKMNLSLKDIKGEILVVSQFTLVADVKRGLRPGFENAEVPEKAKEIFDLVIKFLTQNGIKVKTGIFGARMHVNLLNEGPATFILKSR